MNYDFIKVNEENTFYSVSKDEIKEVEKELNLKFPRELVNFLNEIGYGFIKGSEYNINRIMDPYSIRDFRLRVNDFEFYPDIEIYDAFENDKLIFFEGSESALMSIELNKSNTNSIYYYDIKIADSLKEFLSKIEINDQYYLDLITD
ncbi:SMI1/KNR4 family protein [Alkalihalophilus pseudofirmus]|uniref:SMI1/KNR4 family protein n=1 Tax=Alkalihalophilus pseudofirmus TaxID=79885 RepID=UPI00259B5935|nr:SMI1/KNR4 family protein [Alkalihalophilus pseudofirmus]WEG18956.1 SMI1/KNR4 family protein [Alkalihalophilus pseudofirmus]